MNTPNHIAIIMDGNGRWAKQRGLPRTAGHKEGIEACKRVVKAAGDLGIQYITLFGFSTENWSRPADEVNELMRLLRMYLRAETADLHANNIRLKVIGSRTELAKDIVELIENSEQLTQNNSDLTLIIALNYGGRRELTMAAADMAKHFMDEGLEPSQENAEEFLPQFLFTKDIPDPDIMIRTSGEERISNFLLWQCAYSEFIFTNTLWPDFNKEELQAALQEYQGRERRYGQVSSAQ
ncbi:MAG: isoprenyl transferase [Pseudomonadota bacterium]